MTLAVDFDGVVHRYSRGWHDGTIYDPPMPGALDGLRALLADDAVFIHTTREPEQVMPWLERYGFDVTIDERCGRCFGTGQPNQAACKECKGSGLLVFWNVRRQLLITNRKLPATSYLDDRALRFENWDQAVAALGALARGGPDRLLECGLCYEEGGQEVHPHPECPIGLQGVHTFAELRDTGLLWFLNRLALHPRGLALALHCNSAGRPYGWSLIPSDDGNPWTFDPRTDADGFRRSEITLATALRTAGPIEPCGVCGGEGYATGYRNYRNQFACWPCADCQCGITPCARTGINAPHPDFAKAPAHGRRNTMHLLPNGTPAHSHGSDTSGGPVRTPFIGEDGPRCGPLPTSTDTVRTRPDKDTADSQDSVRTVPGTDEIRAALARAFDVPLDLLQPARCTCGETGKLLALDPTGAHWHATPDSPEFEVNPDLVMVDREQWICLRGAEERLALARAALLADGYFTPDQVGPDLAPRITEWLAHHRSQAGQQEEPPEPSPRPKPGPPRAQPKPSRSER